MIRKERPKCRKVIEEQGLRPLFTSKGIWNGLQCIDAQGFRSMMDRPLRTQMKKMLVEEGRWQDEKDTQHVSRRRRRWGPWRYCRVYRTLTLQENGVDGNYEIDLEAVKDSSSMLGHILRVEKLHGEAVRDLIQAFQSLLDPESNLCSGATIDAKHVVLDRTEDATYEYG